MNTFHPINDVNSLDDITTRKEEIKIDLEERKDYIITSAKHIFGSPAVSSSNSFMKNLGTGIVIFNGVRTGLKMVRSFKSIFKRFK